MSTPKGYTVKIVVADPVQGKPAWRAEVRRKGWIKGYWVYVSSAYGPIAYTSPEYAKQGARVWIKDNESK